LEATATIPLGALTLAGAYTYLDSEVVDAGFDEGEGATFVEGSSLIRRPAHQATVQATYLLGRAVLNGAVRWTGARSDRDFSGWPATPVDLPPFAVFDLGAEAQLFEKSGSRPGLRLNVRVENLLDETYQNVFGFDAPGRALMVGLRAELGG
jgi:vitamin B12 transporter